MQISKPLSRIILFVSLSASASQLAAEGSAMEPETGPKQEQGMTWAEYMTPGEPHQMLLQRVGDWNFTITSWETPDAVPDISSGFATLSPMLGGRYLRQESEHVVHETMRFKTLSIMGYDNLKKKFQGLLLNNSGTGMSFIEGEAESGGAVINYTGQTAQGAPGNYFDVRFVQRTVDENTWTTVMYMTGDNGEEWKRLEMVYTRAE